jgi:hypothetical protein
VRQRVRRYRLPGRNRALLRSMPQYIQRSVSLRTLRQSVRSQRTLRRWQLHYGVLRGGRWCDNLHRNNRAKCEKSVPLRWVQYQMPWKPGVHRRYVRLRRRWDHLVLEPAVVHLPIELPLARGAHPSIALLRQQSRLKCQRQQCGRWRAEPPGARRAPGWH